MEVKWMICDSRDSNWFATVRRREETGLNKKIRCFEREIEHFFIKASMRYGDDVVEQLLVPYKKSSLNTFEFKQQLHAKFHQHISAFYAGTSTWIYNVWSMDPLLAFVARRLEL